MKGFISWTSYAIVASAAAFTPGCSTGESGERREWETSAGGTVVGAAAKVPITTSSDAARRDFLEGRRLAENLRLHDGHVRLRSAVEKDSTFALAWYNLALSAPTAKDFFDNLHRAMSLADRASEGERLMILGLQAGANADPAAQRRYYEELVAKYPGDERAHFLLGNAYFAQQDYPKTVAEYRKATEIEPSYAPAYNLLGYAYRPTGHYAEAEQAFKKYIELIPDDPNPYDSYAELLMKTGRYDESIAMYRKALAVDSNFVNSYFAIAWNYSLKGKPDSALAAADRLERRARNEGERRTARFSRAVTYAEQGKLDRALAEVEKQYAIAERAGDTANMSADAIAMGDILLQAGKPDKALRRYDQAHRLIQESGLSSEVKENARLVRHLNAGRAALARKDVKTAQAEADAFMQGAAAKRNDPQIRQAHGFLGAIALQERQYDEALEHLGHANQQDPYVLYSIGLAHQGKGDTAKAREMFDQARDHNTLPTLNYAFARARIRKVA